MNQPQWRDTILKSIDRKIRAIPSPWGRTPIGELADQIRFGEVSERKQKAAVQAFVDIISSSDRVDAEFWQHLCHLIMLSGLRDRRIRRALHDRFRQHHRDNADVRSLIMTVLTDIGYRFTPKEIRMEEDIKIQYPRRWVEAWVASKVDPGFETAP
jgi:hypothetical protein